MLKVAIDAQLAQSHRGGGTSVLLGLIRALGQLLDGDEQYTVIAVENNAEQIRALAGPNTRVVIKGQGQSVPLTARQRLRRLRNRFGRIFAPSMWPDVPLSDGFYESLGCDLIHFGFPTFTLTRMPAIFQLYDLQHLHYPEYFIPEEVSTREALYPVATRVARAVITGSEWAKRDIHQTYGTPLHKIYPIWGGPPTADSTTMPTDRATLQQKYQLQDPFILYPATMHPHKNHLRLLDALAQLRDQHDMRLNLICTGSLVQPHTTTVNAHIDALNLRDQVRLLGVVPQDDLRGLYDACAFMVFPSQFEGAGYPPLEAFHAGKAVICSDATSLPEAVGEAAMLVNPLDVTALTTALHQLHTDNDLRLDLEARGRVRLQEFDWQTAARTYRAVYRQVGRQKLTEGERSLLVYAE